MKRILAILLTLGILLWLGAVTAFAAEEDEYVYPMDSVEKLEGTIANASNTYVVAPGWHGAVIDLQGLDYDTVVITKNPGAQTMGYTFLQEMPEVGQIPNYAGGYYAVVWDGAERAELEIPGDAAYLYIYYNSKEIVYLPASVVFKNGDEPDPDESDPDEPAWDVSSITVATWNIGHFSMGTNTSTKISDGKFQESSRNYCDYIYDELGADLITLNEYSAMFTPSYRAKNTLFSEYTATRFEGPQYRYSCNALFSKLPVTNLRVCTFSCNQSATISHTSAIKATDYYYLQGEIELGGETVVVVTAHLGFDAIKTPDTVCLDQIDELIRNLSGYDRVLLMGDWNTRDFAYFDCFVEAGYTLGNDDSSCATFAYNSTNRALDNIIVKGLEISDFQVHPTLLSDHYAVSATISLSYDSPAHTHNYSAVVIDATCAQQGYTTYTCDSCDDIYKGDFSEAMGHDQVTIEPVEASCTQTGLTEGRKCGRCGQVLQEQTVTPAAGHSYGPWNGANAGLEQRQCAVCGDVQQRDPGAPDPENPSTVPAAVQDVQEVKASPVWIAAAAVGLAAVVGVAVFLLLRKKKKGSPA